MRAVKYCNGSITKAYVGLWQSKALVSFSGSCSRHGTESLVKDLQSLETATPWDVCENCSVNGQVLEEWSSLEPCIEESLKAVGEDTGSEIRITGHAFGAAVSAVALLALNSKGWKIEESYTFGMPRTGNWHFTYTILLKFSERVFRVTHRQDPLVQVPKQSPNYSHLQPEFFYNQEVFRGFKRCAMDGSRRCSGFYSNITDDMKHAYDHWKYMDIDIGSGCAST